MPRPTRDRAPRAPVRRRQPAQCWLYFLQVEPGSAPRPELEHALDHLHLTDFASFAAAITSPAIEHTARCVDRLLGYDLDPIEGVLRAMPAPRARRLLAADEARCKANAAQATRVAVLARRL